MLLRKVRLIWALALLIATTSARGEDWPQWRGPSRTDISDESGLLQEWPAGGPSRVWLFDGAGSGYSGFAIARGRLFTMGTRNGDAILFALHADTGKEQWFLKMGDLYENGWGDGPRGTPTVDGDRVYALSGRGDLVCASAATGEKLWAVAMKDFGGSIPQWGYSESVLVDGDQVICCPGGDEGAMVALDKMDGRLRWQTVDLADGAQYASPIVIEREGRREYVQLFMRTLAGIAPEDGTVRWTSAWNGRVAVCPTPIFWNGNIYISSGYGVGCKLVKPPVGGGGEAEDIYVNKVMKNHHGGVILVGEHVYGYSDNAGWVCQRIADGEEVWADKKALGKGAIAYADQRLYCLDEREGEIVLISASPKEWQEHGRFTLSPQTEIRSSRGAVWTHPVIANGKMYLRDQDLIYCYDVSQ